MDSSDIVSYALFGDGIATVLVEPDASSRAPKLIDFEFLDTKEVLVSYEIKLSLDRRLLDVVPDLAAQCLKVIFSRHGLSIGDVKHWIVHPAGRRILDNIETKFKINLGISREILKNFGNIGASSVFFILKKIMEEENPQPGDHGVILSFGPGKDGGFTVATCLLKWN
jgi:predicted naringenin-chalcone synthase